MGALDQVLARASLTEPHTDAPLSPAGPSPSPAPAIGAEVAQPPESHDPRPAPLGANNLAERNPSGVTTGALVTWAYAGCWQYGLVVTVRRRDHVAFLVPIDTPRQTLVKPLSELTVIFDAALLQDTVASRHGFLSSL